MQENSEITAPEPEIRKPVRNPMNPREKAGRLSNPIISPATIKTPAAMSSSGLTRFDRIGHGFSFVSNAYG